MTRNVERKKAKYMAFIAGIDEAGRGPVIGPMVMAIVACKDQDDLKRLGAKDSKLLSPEQRGRLAHELRNMQEIGYEIISLSPAEIDAAVQGKAQGDSLNMLEARTAALLILKLAKRMPLSEVILDSPTRTTTKYEEAVRRSLEKIDTEGVTRTIRLRAECKADFNYPVVGAASILAKTTRDEAIEAIAAIHGKVGSGYPSDPDTQAFLNDHWKEQHEFFRRSWESYQRLAGAQSAGQATLADFGAGEEQRSEAHKKAKQFEQLFGHGFRFESPTNKYEVVRMKGDGAYAGVTIISYTTGKVLVQGPEEGKAAAENLLVELKLAPIPKKRGRPKKNS